jgi:hypothetical protein
VVFDSFFKGLSNARLTAFIGIAAALCIAGSFGGGYLVGSRNEARIQTREVLKTVYVPVKEIQEVQVRNVERERELQAEVVRNQQLVSTLRNDLRELAVDNRTLDARVVSLLNEAIAPTDLTTDPTGVPVDPSTTITQYSNWGLDVIEQYNDTSVRYNALIDWVEEELIEPQQ